MLDTALGDRLERGWRLSTSSKTAAPTPLTTPRLHKRLAPHFRALPEGSHMRTRKIGIKEQSKGASEGFPGDIS